MRAKKISGAHSGSDFEIESFDFERSRPMFETRINIKPWMSEETIIHIVGENLWKKRTNTEMDIDRYNTLNRVRSKACRKNKDKFISKVCAETEEHIREKSNQTQRSC